MFTPHTPHINYWGESWTVGGTTWVVDPETGTGGGGREGGARLCTLCVSRGPKVYLTKPPGSLSTQVCNPRTPLYRGYWGRAYGDRLRKSVVPLIKR